MYSFSWNFGSVPVALIKVDTPFFVGEVEALCMDTPLYDLIIGNIPGAFDPQKPNETWRPERPVTMKKTEKVGKTVAAVETRSVAAKKDRPYKPLLVSESCGDTVSREEVTTAQRSDQTLTKLWAHAENDEPYRITGKANKSRYIKSKGMLFREFQSPRIEYGKIFKQLVVPEEMRPKVLTVAHHSPMAGHLGVKKTTDKVLSNFYWPGLTGDHGDVQLYCRSCHICQRTVSKGKVGKVPLGEMPLIDTPFKRIAVDLVGPIHVHPITDRGNRFILVIVDYATRYPKLLLFHA